MYVVDNSRATSLDTSAVPLPCRAKVLDRGLASNMHIAGWPLHPPHVPLQHGGSTFFEAHVRSEDCDAVVQCQVIDLSIAVLVRVTATVSSQQHDAKGLNGRRR